MTDRATTYDELKDAISDAYPSLSPQLQRLARHSSTSRTTSPWHGGGGGRTSAVQPSSTVRFAHASADGFLADAAGVPAATW
jgi:hypothetical protein